jgi:cytochrome oxidase assembly protein ShyY1
MTKRTTWLLLRVLFPSVCIGLGTWQLYRLQWKKDLIERLEAGLKKRAITVESLPPDPSTLAFRRVKLIGTIDTSKPMIMMSARGAREIGVDFAHSLILPFRLAQGYGLA